MGKVRAAAEGEEVEAEARATDGTGVRGYKVVEGTLPAVPSAALSTWTASMLCRTEVGENTGQVGCWDGWVVGRRWAFVACLPQISLLIFSFFYFFL